MNTRSKRRRLSRFGLLLATILLAGCGSLGPRTLDKDQLDYGHSIGENWKNQMLANIVKIRFVDMPVFVDVGSIVSGYSFETTVNGRIGFGDSITGGDSQGLGASGRYTDRPTITYMPKTGDAYLRSLLAPIEPRNLLALVQSGYNSEFLFTWAVEAINGLSNYPGAVQSNRQRDPEFQEFIAILRQLQQSGAVGFELRKDHDSGHDVILKLRQRQESAETEAQRRRMAEILQVDPALDRLPVVYAPFRVDDATLSIQTRSVLQILIAMSQFVEVPAAIADHTAPGVVLASAGADAPFRVRSGTERPNSAFAAIRYANHWFWIENSDLASKRVFTLMLFLTTLTNRTEDASGPVLTIPTG